MGERDIREFCPPVSAERHLGKLAEVEIGTSESFSRKNCSVAPTKGGFQQFLCFDNYQKDGIKI